MKRVGEKDLYEGLVMAEALVDKDDQVLLEANTVLTCRHIELLHSWDISFVRVREPGDTEESLAKQLQADREQEEREEQEKQKKRRKKFQAPMTPWFASA